MSAGGASIATADSEIPPEIAQEQEINKHGNNQLASNTYQKLIELKERELRDSIMANYGRIKAVEKELADLQIQLQVNVGPRKHALELLRHKIEKQNEKVAKIRVKYVAAKQAMLTLEEELTREEAAKDRLCAELALLVQQSATAQLQKLEELKNHLELLNGGLSTNKPQEGAQRSQSDTHHANGKPPSTLTPQSSDPVATAGHAHSHVLSHRVSVPDSGATTPSTSSAQHPTHIHPQHHHGQSGQSSQGMHPDATGTSSMSSVSNLRATTHATTGARPSTGGHHHADQRYAGGGRDTSGGASGTGGGPAAQDDHQKRLLAEVAAARAKMSQGGGMVSPAGTPRSASTSAPGGVRVSPAIAGASLLAAVSLAEDSAQRSSPRARAQTGYAGAQPQQGRQQQAGSKFMGFDV